MNDEERHTFRVMQASIIFLGASQLITYVGLLTGVWQ